MEAEQSVAWYMKIQGGPPGVTGDVYDDTRTQCFQKWRKVPRSVWRTDWVTAPLKNRIATPGGKIYYAAYRAGTYPPTCSDPAFPANGNVLSQYGSYALVHSCGYTDWKAVDKYYYGAASVQQGIAPTTPTTSFSTGTGTVTLTFESQVRNGSGLTSNVAWQYYLERKLSDGWHVVSHARWQWSTRSIPTSYTYSPGGCYKYRVKGVNPVKASHYASYNNGNTVCPG